MPFTTEIPINIPDTTTDEIIIEENSNSNSDLLNDNLPD